MAVDDEQCLALMRLFAEAVGRDHLLNQGVPSELVEELHMLGISSICNLVAAIKTAHYFELDSRDMLFTPLTDSMDLYGSRVEERCRIHGPYEEAVAVADFARYLQGIGTDNMRELGYHDRKAVHNLKYFTWIEQQGRDVDELERLWDPDFWTETYAIVDEWDRQIVNFNARVGLT